MFKINPTGTTLARLAWVAWTLFIVTIVATEITGVLHPRWALAAAIIASNLSVIAAFRHHGARMEAAKRTLGDRQEASNEQLAERIEAAVKMHADRIEVAVRGHADTMGEQVLNADRLVTLRWKGEATAAMDAAKAFSGSDTGPFQIINGSGR